MPPLTVGAIAALAGSVADGDNGRVITGANTLEDAGPADLAFVSHTKAEASAARSQAGCLLVQPGSPLLGPWSLIRVADPRTAFARLLAVLYPAQPKQSFRHPTAVIAAAAVIADKVFIGPHVTVGDRATIASGCSIAAGCVIGEDVSLGPDVTLHPNVTLYPGVRIGARTIIHAGCVIGADGFGFARTPHGYEKFPQVGTVSVEEDVEIGANTCIDRAALGTTVIGRGSKLDNLIHVAHNVRVGRDVIIAAQTGFSGGCGIGDNAVVGGQVGFGDKAVVDSNAVIGSQAGILTGQRIQAGEPVWGTPARPLKQHLKGLAYVSRLGQYREEIKQLKQQLAALQAKLKDPE